MHKPTSKEMIVMLVIGVGTVVALAFTDFGLSAAALAGIFTTLAVVLGSGHTARRCRRSAS